MTPIKNHIPNAITCMNLFCGCLATLFAFKGGDSNILISALLICGAAIFDFLDGFMARLLKAYSPMGKELDSLADLVSFGFAPAMIAFNFVAGMIDGVSEEYNYIPYITLLITIFAALRLAKFNVDERQEFSFIGLPVPANALFWIGAYFFVGENIIPSSGVVDTLLVISGWFAMVFLMSYLMVSEMPMFSLKFKNLSIKDNLIRYILIVVSIISLILFKIGGFFIIILFYILLSKIDVLIKMHKTK